MKIEELYTIYLKSGKVITDSRKVEKGSIFFALRGANFDGNEFADEALRKGASLVVIDNPDFAKNKNTLLVEDSLLKLQELAHYHRMQLKSVFLAITGTNGKTTTKELVHKVLSRKYKCQATKGNLNNHIGVPLTLLSIEKETEFAIIEMGANHPGEIAALSKIAAPDFGFITNVGKAHLEGFGSLEGVIKTKTELYQFIRENNRKVFVNSNNTILMDHSSGLSRITFGTPKDSVWAELQNPFPFLSIQVFMGNHSFLVSTKLIGKYNQENVLAAAAIGNYFSVKLPDIKAALETYQPENYRSQYINTAHNEIILDAYNANPTSMKLSIENFLLSQVENKMMILGDMLELGKDSAKEHQEIIFWVSKFKNINVLWVGEAFYQLKNEDQLFFKSYNEVEKYLLNAPIRNFQILIKGSRGIGLERLLPLL